MKCLRIDVPVLADLYFPIDELIVQLTKLQEKYGKDTMIGVDAGANNVSVYVEVEPKD